MGTQNFHIVGTHPVVYAVLMPYVDDEGMQRNTEEWEYEDLIDNVNSEIASLPNSLLTKFKDRNELGAYPSRTMNSLVYSKEYKLNADNTITIEVVLTAIIRAGYYEGCNLDYQLSWFIDNDDLSELELTDLPETLMSFYGCTQKQAEKMSGTLIKFLAINHIKLMKEMTNIFDQWAEHKLRLDAVVSNGEGVYSKIN